MFGHSPFGAIHSVPAAFSSGVSFFMFIPFPFNLCGGRPARVVGYSFGLDDCASLVAQFSQRSVPSS